MKTWIGNLIILYPQSLNNLISEKEAQLGGRAAKRLNAQWLLSLSHIMFQNMHLLFVLVSLQNINPCSYLRHANLKKIKWAKSLLWDYQVFIFWEKGSSALVSSMKEQQNCTGCSFFIIYFNMNLLLASLKRSTLALIQRWFDAHRVSQN